MKGDPQFVILKYQAWMEAAVFEEVILGAIIKDPLSPSTNYVPDLPLTYKIHEHQEGSATEFVLAKTGTTSNELTTSLKSIGGYSVSGKKEDAVQLAGKFIRYKRIQQLDRFWSKLKEDRDVKNIAPEWVSIFNTWPACLVVGIMICEDIELSMDGAQSRKHEGNVQLPVGQITLATGVPNPAGSSGDPSIQLASAKQTATIFKAKLGKSSIFAVELKKITTGLFRKKELQLRSDGPDVDRIRLAGDDSEGEEEDLNRPVIADELILDELSPEDYDDLVG